MKVNENGQFGQNKTNLGSSVAERTMVTGMFKDRESAENAYKILESRGYSKDDVNIMMSDKVRDKYFKNAVETELGTKAMQGAGAGSAIGGTLGAIVGAIAAIGTSLLIPGLGLVIAGPIAAALAGAGAGGVTGGLIGALVGSGIPEEHAKRYEAGIKEGNIVMGVHPRSDEDAEFIEKSWNSNKDQKVYS